MSSVSVHSRRDVLIKESLRLRNGRSALTGTAQLLTSLVPSPRHHSHFVCPVPSCNREDLSGYLSSHLVADHFSLVKAASCVLERLVRESVSGGCCAISPHCPHAPSHSECPTVCPLGSVPPTGTTRLMTQSCHSSPCTHPPACCGHTRSYIAHHQPRPLMPSALPVTSDL